MSGRLECLSFVGVIVGELGTKAAKNGIHLARSSAAGKQFADRSTGVSKRRLGLAPQRDLVGKKRAAAGLGAVMREEFFSANCRGLASDLEAGGNRTAISRSLSRLSRIDVLLRLWQHHYLPDHTQIVMQNAFVVVCPRLRESDSETRRIQCYRVVGI